MRVAIVSFMLALASAATTAAPTMAPVNRGINAASLGIVVNDADPLSVQIGNLYAQMRKVPASNILHVNFKPGETTMSPETFKVIKQTLDAATPATVQAYLLTWNAPYRVGRMSITSAFAFGYDIKWTSTTLCASTARSPYYNSISTKPYTDLKVRPTMALGATTLAEAQTLIQRSVSAGATNPTGTAYLLSTTDALRNVRSYTYGAIQQKLTPYIDVQQLNANTLSDKQDVMFYFTGLERVANLTTNRFRPGAVADHLTSFGGMLTDSPQMSALQWLRAGASASYGTVTEPCNFTAKYPNPQLMMQYYLSGQTVIESYWKSVMWPGEGIFVGDPLTRPYNGYRMKTTVNGNYSVSFPWLQAGTYNIMVAEDPTMPYRLYRQASIYANGPLTVELSPSPNAFYRIERVGAYSLIDSTKVYTALRTY